MSAAYDHPDLTMEPSAYFRRQCYLSVERFLELPLSSQAKRKFLWDNCAKLYRFDD